VDRKIEHNKIGCGALVGLGVIAIVQMLSVDGLDAPLNVSVWSFAFSIPSLSVTFMCSVTESQFGFTTNKGIYALPLSGLSYFGHLASFVGISGLFFHFSILAGLIFMAISLFGFSIFVEFDSELDRLSRGKRPITQALTEANPEKVLRSEIIFRVPIGAGPCLFFDQGADARRYVVIGIDLVNPFSRQLRIMTGNQYLRRSANATVFTSNVNTIDRHCLYAGLANNLRIPNS